MKKNFFNNRSLKFKVLNTPLIILFVVIALISSISIYITQDRLINQMKSDGINLSRQISNQINNNTVAMNIIDDSIATRIRTIANFMNGEGDKINDNNYLSKLVKCFEVDELNIVDSSCKVVYSNVPSSLGVDFSKVGNAEVFNLICTGKKDEYMESIRKSRNSDYYYKYGYIKKPGGGMIQVGILANKIEKLNKELSYQTLVENLTKDKNIVYAAYINKELKIQAHSDKEKVGQTINSKEVKESINTGKYYSSIDKYKKNNTKVYNILAPVYKDNKYIGEINIGLSMKNVNEAIRKIIVLILILAIVSFLVASKIFYSISKNIVDPVGNIVVFSKKIAEGEFDYNIEYSGKDEIGELALNFRKMCESLKQTIQNIKDQAYKTEDMSNNLSNNAKQMTLVTNEVANAIQEVTKGATEQASDLSEVTNNIINLDKEINNMKSKLELAKHSSNETEEKANIGKEKIDILLKSIEDIKESFEIVSNKVNVLNDSVSQVGNITEVINGISEQTNLLALNAAIEAARAGEAGKGFAVVAEEVRMLAERSKESTEKIQSLVSSISHETINVANTSNKVGNLVESQVNTVKESIESFNDVLNAISNVIPLIDDTYVSLDNTIKSKDVVSDKVSEVSSVSEETSASSEEISASSEEMLANSEEVSRYALELNKVAVKLNDEVNKFKL
ncbi:methyl-accepting chemotaxis protein McpB [Clostridium acetireducens DSM 10703]|uniref:Methyl-accepting chemotaxis protein McpB n=1 Tax=Clostridium acetireducens DSM 10703 TaxID=1121290 RepID=A0A1E8EVX2_9CLOT|nr:methyl-accepting chemotaxis protein [Clostridium acetireducens]OFI01411.1 methyl-accepting chemotaxis protein McpB [Clostridium acetireducens DSM 10703]